MGQIQIQEVTADQAAQALARAGVIDPRGENSPADIARGGACLRVRTDNGDCFIVARVQGDTLWMDGAASDRSEGLAPLLGLLAQESARNAGCKRVKFETARPGLVRLARRRGWRFAAFVMEKDV